MYMSNTFVVAISASYSVHTKHKIDLHLTQFKLANCNCVSLIFCGSNFSLLNKINNLRDLKDMT